MRKYVFMVMVICCVSAYAIENVWYESEIDGNVIFENGKLTTEIIDYPYNVKNCSYDIKIESNLKYLCFNNQKLLMLINDEFIYLVTDKNSLLYFGISSSGRLVDFILEANVYAATSYLIENGIQYNPANMAYIKGGKPYAEGENDYGSTTVITLSWDEPIQQLVIINGFISYIKPYLYVYNNRLMKILITEDNGPSYEAELEDMADPQIITLRSKCTKITIRILAVYNGSKYNDTCITMINGISSAATLY